MKKVNCWEYKKCGREPGGARKELGVCSAAIERRLDRIHGGSHAGRACWVIAGTMCGGQEQGTFAAKYHNCEQCDFYKLVRTEEGARYKLSILLLRKLAEPIPPVDEKKISALTAVS
jgi:hypothetical protein